MCQINASAYILFCSMFIGFHVQWCLHGRIDMAVSTGWIKKGCFRCGCSSSSHYPECSVCHGALLSTYYLYWHEIPISSCPAAARPLLFSLSKWSENDIQSLDRYEGGRLEIFTKNMQYIDWIISTVTTETFSYKYFWIYSTHIIHWKQFMKY